MRPAMLFYLLLLPTFPLAAQSPSLDAEVRLARSAAPPAVSQHAKVWVLSDGMYEVAEEGTTDVECMVARSRPGSREPICYDAEGARTMLPMEIRRTELRLAGTPPDEIDRIIAEGVGRGEFAIPRRPAMAYMLSSGQRLVAEDGREVGSWYPHLMLYVPYLTAADVGLSGPPSIGAGMVFNEGEPTAHLIVVVREFVDP